MHCGSMVFLFFFLPSFGRIFTLYQFHHLKAFTPFQFHVHGLLAFFVLHPPFRRLIYPFEQPGLLLVIIGDIMAN